MERKVDPTKDHGFFANACQVCRVYGKDVQLKRCSQCKSIAYCSQEHQKEHWPKHKDYCRVLSKVVNIFNPTSGQSKFADSMSWKKARLYMVLMLQIELGRELSNYETELVIFPRACEICHETDPRKLSDCPDCPDASFCLEHPRDSKHSAQCETSRLRFESNIFSEDFMNTPLAWKTVESYYGKSAPKNMEEAIELFAPRCPTDELMKVSAALISDILTCPYTFLYSLEQLSHPKLPSTTIHVIVRGAAEMIDCDFWHLLFHHDLPFKEFKIVLVGPGLSPRSKEVLLCLKCKNKNCRIIVQTFGDLYADFAARPFFQKPDYVIGFNIALLNDDSLIPTVGVLAQLGCPFIVTTFIAQETERNEVRIDRFVGKKVKPIWVGKNPFSSLKPCKEFEMDGFFYHNQYLIIYESLA